MWHVQQQRASGLFGVPPVTDPLDLVHLLWLALFGAKHGLDKAVNDKALWARTTGVYGCNWSC